MNKKMKKALLSMLTSAMVVTASAATMLCVDVAVDNKAAASTTEQSVGFTMVDGASIRMATPLGMRFIAEMDDEVYEDLMTKEANVEKKMGMFIMPYEYLSDASQYSNGSTGVANKEYQNITTKIDYTFYDENEGINKLYEYNDGETYRANGVITNLYLKNYDRDFIGIAYIAETTSTGTTYTFADFDEENNVRNAAYVAIEAYEDYTDSKPRDVFNEYVWGAHLESLGMTETVTVNGDTRKVTYTYAGANYNSISAVREAAGYTNFSLSLNKSVAYIKNVGDSINLTATIKGANSEVNFNGAHANWSSSNEDVVTVDENGKVYAKEAGEATITVSFMGVKATCEIIVSEASFETMEHIPSYMSKAGTTVELLYADVDTTHGGRTLQIQSSDTGASPSLNVTRDFLAAFFEDPTVDYIAFDAKSEMSTTTNFRRSTIRTTGSIGSWGQEPYEADIVADNTQIMGIKSDAFKTFYFSRLDYNNWVDNNKTQELFITVGNFEKGDCVYLDNIRPVTEAERVAACYSFETGGIRPNGGNLLVYMANTGSTWQYAITADNVNGSKPTFSDYWFVNDGASHGGRALAFVKTAGQITMRMNSTSVQMYKDIAQKTGYYAFDLYVSGGSDAQLISRYLTNSVIPGHASARGEGWTTFYLKPNDNVSLQLSDTTGGMYMLDGFRSISESEYKAAMYSFEAGTGGLRTNLLNDANTGSGAFYFYGWKDDYSGVAATITVAEGNGSGDTNAVSNARFDTEIVHGGNYSLAFDKGSGYMYMTWHANSKSYEYLGGGFSFWIYSTVSINGTTASNIVAGDNGKLNGGQGLTLVKNTWTKITITPDDLSGARFLILQGSSAGTIYLDDFQPLKPQTITYNAAGGSVDATTQEVFQGGNVTLKTPIGPKMYQEFLGWYDEEGNLVESGIWNYDRDVTLTAAYGDRMSFEYGTTVPSFFKMADTTESLSIVSMDGTDGSKVLQVKNQATGAAPALIVTREFLASFFEDSTVEYVAFDAKTELGNYNNFRRVTLRSNGTFAADCYVNDLVVDNVPITGIRNDAFKTFYFSRADYNAWVAQGVTEQRIIASGGIKGGDCFYVDNIRPVTAAEYERAIYSFEGDGVRINDEGKTLLMYTTKSVGDWSFNLQVGDGHAFSNVGYTNEYVSHGIRAFTFTKDAGTVNINFNSSKQAYADITTKTNFYAVDVYVPEGMSFTSNGEIVPNGEWKTIFVTGTNVLTITDTTGGTYVIDNIRSVTATEYGDALTQYESSLMYKATKTENGGVVLEASSHTGGANAMPLGVDDVENMSYIRFDGKYGLNDYLVFDFTGNNVPMMSFFTTKVGATTYNQAEDENAKGWVVANGATTNSGVMYGGIEGAHANRVAIIGPYKISYKFDDNGNADDSNPKATLSQLRTSEGSATDPSPIAMAQLVGSTDQYRMIVGWEANGTNMNLRMYAFNLTTGKVVVDYNLNKGLPKADWEGDIVLYGHFGKVTTIDKLYDIEQDSTMSAVMEKYAPPMVVYNGEWNGDELTLAASTHVGAVNNVPLNSGYKPDMSYIAFQGSYGLNDYFVFDFTGDNFPFVSFFNTEVTNTIFNFANDTSIGGWIIANGIKTPNGSSYGGDAGAHANRLLFVGSNKISYRYDDNGSTSQWRSSIGSAASPSPIAITPLKSVKDTYRAIIGYVDNGGNGAKAIIYVINMVTGDVVVNYAHGLANSYSEGSIILYGQFGTGTVLNQVFGVEEDTTLEALKAKYAKDVDYSDEADVVLDRYAYSGPSNGKWTIDGTQQTPYEDARTVEQYTVYKEAGFNIVLAQDTIVTSPSTWNDAMGGKEVLDRAYAAGLKVILTDYRIQNLSEPITVSTGASSASGTAWAIKTHYKTAEQQSAFQSKYGLSSSNINAKYGTTADLDAEIASYIALYKDHPAFYGVMLGDEPSYHNAYCYGEVYKSLKRLMPDKYVQYNLLPMEHNFDTIELRYPGIKGVYSESKITNANIEDAYKQYVEMYLDSMQTDYIQYDDYPFKGKQTGNWLMGYKYTTYIDPTALRCLQIMATIAKERNLSVKVVTQSCVMKSGGEDGYVSIRQLTEDDARWLNNYLVGFGVKQINYFTYWTKSANSTSGEWFVDGGSFVNRDGTKTALYDIMQEIMAENTEFARTISHFNYTGSKIVTGSSYKYSKDHINWGTLTSNSSTFKWLSGVTTSTDATLVTELYDASRYNYMYMFMNTIDPYEKNNNGNDTKQTITITLNAAVTGFYLYDQTGARSYVSGNSTTVNLEAGQAVYVLPCL